jgi:hypothetical protein
MTENTFSKKIEQRGYRYLPTRHLPQEMYIKQNTFTKKIKQRGYLPSTNRYRYLPQELYGIRVMKEFDFERQLNLPDAKGSMSLPARPTNSLIQVTAISCSNTLPD